MYLLIFSLPISARPYLWERILSESPPYGVTLWAEFFRSGKLKHQRVRLKLKKVGKTMRLFRYALKQIPYDYTVEVTNRFKGLDLRERVPENYRQRFVTLYRRQ